MKAYLATTSTIFALIVIMHVLRAFSEGLGAIADPFFLGMTLLAVGLCVWGFRLLFRLRRSGAH